MIDQAGIVVFGALAVWLSQDRREERRRWSSIAGLASQPFWFYAAWKAQQWGVFAISFIYLLAWVRGFWNYWVRAPKGQGGFR